MFSGLYQIIKLVLMLQTAIVCIYVTYGENNLYIYIYIYINIHIVYLYIYLYRIYT